MKSQQIIRIADLKKGTILTLVMAVSFSLIGGLPLMITFIPGLVFTWIAFFYLFKKKIELPTINHFLPIFFIIFSWQFIHFCEEFLTHFYIEFPTLYGSKPYSQEKFVAINMVSYFIFALAAVASFKTNHKFLLIPVLFYVIYGAMGNAIAHTWWSIFMGKYFSGLITAQAYWFLGTLILSKIIQNSKITILLLSVFASTLVSLLTLFME